ncbi:hypothetical protein NDU88_007097 [Pleurodeles waltl]|uniref:Uncharacterized protein n=1 Tax=Pleurodeles waltl TaxID=8319 RepID=A0AAV7UQY6_PLEWA|nr:hypothetical protein NDU88_007097 [Pleurodeles waltl]
MCLPAFGGTRIQSASLEEEGEAPGGRLRHWERAALELRRVRRGAARIPLRGNPGRISTSKDPGSAATRAKQAAGKEAVAAGEPREPGQLKGQALHREKGKMIVRREVGTTTMEEGDREEDEDGIELPDGSGRPRDLTGPSAPLECGRGEKTRTAAVPIGDKESRLRGAERYYLPRFRRSVAESGTWTWPGQG